MSRFVTDSGKPRPIVNFATGQPWWIDLSALVTVAEFGIDVGELDSAVAVLRFFEKPYHFGSLHDAWLDDQDVQGEFQDEARYS